MIDYGTLGVADPAVDVIPAWSFFDRQTRPIFREALDVDDETWARGRGWALSQAANIIPYYRRTNPGLVAVADRMLRQILADDL